MANLGKKGGQKHPKMQKHTPTTDIGFQSVDFGGVWAIIVRVKIDEFSVLTSLLMSFKGF